MDELELAAELETEIVAEATLPDESDQGEAAPTPPASDTPVVAEAACDVGDDLDLHDRELIQSVMEMCDRRVKQHRKRLKQMRLFESLWDAAFLVKKFLNQ